MRFMIRGTYQRIVQQPLSSSCTTDTTSTTANKEDVYSCFRGERFHVPQYWNPLLVDCLFRCSFALLFLSMLFSLVCFLVGIWTVGSQFAVIHACGIAATTVQKVFCLELDWLGFPQVKCGKDFHILCKEWSDVDFTGILWSGFLAFVIHFYLVASTGFAAHQRRSIPALLAQYNLVVQSVQRPEQPEQTPPPPSKQPQLSEQPLTIVERTAGSVAT
ncbi:expressed unknown protein [Seminavis robusta]|uniref:Uncharacterized protein n=1 Tax=Seminavis robusta TaxID=568900 RepID=A0A9N8H126_9STRA|nr:expressed unknown protein [Seminavis robusta]|eukprot:Sro10_g007770.1 n/a (217) ;mRNA; f:2623-3273